MGKINKKAKWSRHNRILEQGYILTKRYKDTIYSRIKFLITSLFILFMIPIFPVFSNYIDNSYIYNFDREDIDENTIISSYTYQKTNKNNSYTIIDSDDSYFFVNVGIKENTSIGNTNEYIEVYTVLEEETIQDIAEKYEISPETIIWENNLLLNSKEDVIKEGTKLNILPITGITYKVQSGDSLEKIANLYNVDKSDIMRQNFLLEDSDLKIDDIIILPGAEKKEVPAFNIDQNGMYQLRWRQPQHTFYWGNCTWYVAQYKNVNWGGNANQWFRNAQAKGHATGHEARVGAIITFLGHGYHPLYGHVGIVMKVNKDTIIINDMNYRALGEVTTREIPRYSPAIQGYIYVD